MTTNNPGNPGPHRLLLAADIGATNSRFALFRVASDPDDDAPPLALLREKWLAGADYPDFPAALAALTASTPEGPPLPAEDEPLAGAVIAPAGPIRGESCRISNLPWLVRAQDARAGLNVARVALINDFSAQAHACLLPEQIDLAPVPNARTQGSAPSPDAPFPSAPSPGAPFPGTPSPGAPSPDASFPDAPPPGTLFPGTPSPDAHFPDAPVAVVGAGTGFGQALLLRPAPPAGKESRSALLRRLRLARVLPSEGGHADFPFSGPRELAFAAFVAQRTHTSRLIGDQIVSGSGLAQILAFLTGRDLDPKEATAVAAGLPECIAWFARFYGRACRQYVLHTLALGGLCITGGMALRVPVLQHPAFAEEFHASATQRTLLESVPVLQARKAQAGLWGAALYGLLHLLPEE